MIKRLARYREKSKNQEHLWSKDYILIMFSALCHAMMTQFYLAATPLFVNKLGGMALQAGLFSSVTAIAALVTRPLSGIMADKFGRSRQLVIGAVLCTVSSFLFGFFSVIPILLVFRAIQGVGFGMHSTSAGAAIADVVPESRMAEGIGYFGLHSSLGQAIGPGIALAIVAGDTMNDYRKLFFLTAGLCFLSIISNNFISYERKRKKAAQLATAQLATAQLAAAQTDQLSATSTTQQSTTPDAQQSDTPAPQVEKQPTAAQTSRSDRPLPKTILGFEYSMFAPGLVVLLLFIGLSCLSVYMAPFARWKGLGNPGMYYTFNALGSFSSRIIFGRVADKRGSDIIIIPGMIVVTVCLCLLPFTRSLTTLVALGFPLGLAFGAMSPTFNSMYFKRCSPERRGTASGAFFSAIDMGYAFGAPLLGAIADILNFDFIYWTGAVFVVAGLALYLLIASDKQYNRRRLRAAG